MSYYFIPNVIDYLATVLRKSSAVSFRLSRPIIFSYRYTFFSIMSLFDISNSFFCESYRDSICNCL